ncbi:MAG TPA: hypothetical protein VFK90_14125 [Anaeromyxobacter sp.]|nr:hypothetical protein [Anaeromyxobacter sp.]
MRVLPVATVRWYGESMTLHVTLAVAALVAAGSLFLSASSRALATIALVAAGLEVAMAFGMIRLAVAGVPLGLVLGLALAVPGALAWLRASAKAAISAAAIVSLAGVLQVLSSLGGRI